MEFRHLGRSGLVISEIAYGNWITHGSQVEEDAALACVRAALDAGITTFDTADVYAGTRAAKAMADELRIQLVSNQPQYSMLWRVIEAEVVPTSEELGLGQIVWSPVAQGILTGKYLPGAALPAGTRATDEASGANFIR